MTLLSLDTFYVLAGLMLGVVAFSAARSTTDPRRIGQAIFWGLLAVIYIFGKQIPPVVVGWSVCALAILAAAGQVRSPINSTVHRERRTPPALSLGNRIFVPAMVIPVTTVMGTMFLAKLPLGAVRLFDARQPTLAALGLGCLLALGVGLFITRSAPSVALREGGNLLQTIGWALLLPQLLAALGGIFARAGLGEIIADLVGRVFPTQYAFIAVAVYCVGMALFTICLGNAFAAFPVITLGIGLPIIVRQHGGNPAIMAAIGMLSGYCGTLLTPMAANFNIVPTMLLELRDQHAVIKAQIPIAVTILLANILLLYLCVYRF